MKVYIDTSFLVSIYLDDQYSGEAEQWLKSAPDISLTKLHMAEWTHAIEQHVFRGNLSPAESRVVHELLEEDIRNGVWNILMLPESAYDRCTDLARHYTGKFGTRTLDSLHVAAALELGAAQFWTFDVRQQKLAKAAGLDVR